MILNLCFLFPTICILSKSENASSPFDLDFSHLMNVDYFLFFPFLRFFLFRIKYKTMA